MLITRKKKKTRKKNINQAFKHYQVALNILIIRTFVVKDRNTFIHGPVLCKLFKSQISMK